MLTSLLLKNFKCFENETFPLRPLTMLTGLNSTGKSTVLQAMLLLRQSYDDRILQTEGLTLDGELVQLGTARDVLYEGATNEIIEFVISWTDDSQMRFVFGYDEASDVLKLIKAPADTNLAIYNLFNDRFQYLEAERLGPRSAFDMSEFNVQRHRQIGSEGEFTAHFMARFGSDLVADARMHHPSANSAQLRDQVEAWMGEISPGLRLRFNPHRAMDLVDFGISFSSMGSVSTDDYRSANVGFGITYALPIVVSLLSSSSGSMVFLENPEAHLHPRAQSKLGELIARASTSGVQVIFETHSDHVLNGVRIAVKTGVLEASDAIILFFDNEADGEHRRSKSFALDIDPQGRINEWPKNFFDEFEKSIERLL